MLMTELIAKKRDGGTLSKEEIDFIIDGYTRGDIPDYQMSALLMAMNVIERLFALLLHIGPTVIVYYGVVNGKKACLPLAIVLHMLVDTCPVLYQRGLVPLWAVEVWAAVWTAAIMFLAVRLYRKMGAPSRD